jgi:hypothetical protein
MAASPQETGAQAGSKKFGRREFLRGAALVGAGSLAAACGATVEAQPPQTGPAEVPPSPTTTPTRTPTRAATATREASATRRPTSTPKAVATEVPVSPTATPIVVETAAPEIRPVVITDGWNTGVPSGSGYEQAHLALSEFVAQEGNLEAVGITEDYAFYSVNFGDTFSIIARTENGEFYSWNGSTLAPMNAVSGEGRRLYFYRWSEVDKQNRPNDNTATGQFAIQNAQGDWETAPNGSMYWQLANEPALTQLPAVEQPTAKPEAEPNVPVLADLDWNSNSTKVVNLYNTPGWASGYISSTKSPETSDIHTSLLSVRIEEVKKVGKRIEMTAYGGDTEDQSRQLRAAGRFNVVIENGKVTVWISPQIPWDKGWRAQPVAPGPNTEGYVWLSDQVIGELSGRLAQIEVGSTYQEGVDRIAAAKAGNPLQVKRINFFGAENPVVKQ